MCSHGAKEATYPHREKEHEDGPEKVTLAKNFTLKELSEVFPNIKSTSDKMLEAGPDLERSTMIYSGIRKVLTHILSSRSDEGSSVQITGDP